MKDFVLKVIRCNMYYIIKKYKPSTLITYCIDTFYILMSGSKTIFWHLNL